MRSNSGLSLVEVLISLVILAIGLVGVVNCISSAVITNHKTNRIAIATSITQAAIEQVRSSGTFVSSSTNLDDPLLPSGVLDVTVSPYDAALGLTRVEAEVRWRGQNGKTESVLMQSVVSKRMKHVGG